jgi:hypothetical protein
MGIYNISFKEKIPSTNTSAKTSEKETSTAGNEEKSALEKVAEAIGLSKNKEKIYSLSDESVIAPTITEDGKKINYYLRSNGSVYEVYLNGEGKQRIDNNNFSGLESVLWSSDKSKVISRFNNNGKIEYSSFDYALKKGFKLASGMEYAVWSNLGNQIIYKYSDSKTGKKNISMADYDGSNWKKITDISVSDAWIASVPQSSFVSFWNSPNSFNETSLNLVSTLGGEIRKIFSGRFGADYLWSPNGTKSLVSYVESKGGSKIWLAVINNNGGEFQNLNVPTFVSKCIWSKDNKTIYYAVPAFSSENYILPNDYQSRKVITSDTFWKMDITSGKSERLAETKDINSSYDASNLILSPSEDILFFINKNDGKLYGINL